MEATTNFDATSWVNALVEALRVPDGGGTYGLDGSTPSSGYALSVSPELSVVFPRAADVTAGGVAAFVERAGEALRAQGAYVGGWHDPATGAAHLDVSVVVGNESVARAACKGAEQLAYYDLSRGESVAV